MTVRLAVAACFLFPASLLLGQVELFLDQYPDQDDNDEQFPPRYDTGPAEIFPIPGAGFFYTIRNYFETDFNQQLELWYTDLTEGGARLVGKFNRLNSQPPFQRSSGDIEYQEYGYTNGRFVFSAYDGTGDYLFASDGVTVEQLMELNSRHSLKHVATYEDVSLLHVSRGLDEQGYGDIALYRYDGNGLELLSDRYMSGGNIQDFARIGDDLYFVESDGLGPDDGYIIKFDGSSFEDVSTPVVGFVDWSEEKAAFEFTPDRLIAMGSRLILFGYKFGEQTGHGDEHGVFSLDVESGVFEILHRNHSHVQPDMGQPLAGVGGEVYFAAAPESTTAEEAASSTQRVTIYKSDGTREGTVPLRTFERTQDYPFPYVNVDLIENTDTHLFFTVRLYSDAESLQSLELASGNITEVYRGRMADVTYAASSSRFFFRAPLGDSLSDHRLWVSDGTKAGTQSISTTANGDVYRMWDTMSLEGDRVYFVAKHEETLVDLWYLEETAIPQPLTAPEITSLSYRDGALVIEGRYDYVEDGRRFFLEESSDGLLGPWTILEEITRPEPAGEENLHRFESTLTDLEGSLMLRVKAKR